MHEAEQKHRREIKREADGVGNGRTEEVEKSADGGPGNSRELGGRGGGGNRARKQRSRHHVGQQGLLDRRIERPPDPEHEHRHKDEFLGHPTGGGPDRQRRRSQPFHGLADLQQPPAVVAVGDLARHQHEGGRRQELDEADQTEVEGAAGERVQLPGHRYAQHLEAHGGAGARGPIEREGAVAQDGVRHGGGRVHRRGLTSCRRQRLRPRLGKDARFGVVEPRGVEPLTSSLRTRRSPN